MDVETVWLYSYKEGLSDMSDLEKDTQTRYLFVIILVLSGIALSIAPFFFMK